MYEKGQILEVQAEYDNLLQLARNQKFLVLETPDTFPILGSYMLQPLGLEEQLEGRIVTPGNTVPRELFERASYAVVGKIDNLNWRYGRDVGSSLVELVLNNPALTEYVPTVVNF